MYSTIYTESLSVSTLVDPLNSIKVSLNYSKIYCEFNASSLAVLLAQCVDI